MGRRNFKSIETSFCFPLRRLRRNVRRSKEKSVSSDLGILYPAPEIWNPNLNFKICWREILLLAPRNYFLCLQLRSSLGLVIPRDSFWGSLFAFLLWGLLCFSFAGELHEWWNGEMVKWQKTILPLWGFTILLLSWGTASTTKGLYCLHSPRPSCRLHIYRRLKYYTPCCLKMLPNLNFKLKFQN